MRCQQSVQAACVREVAEPAADDLVQDFRVDEMEQRADPGLARGDDLPPERVKPPAQVPQHALGQVSGLVADLPERPRPGQRACGRDGEHEHQDVAAPPWPRALRAVRAWLPRGPHCGTDGRPGPRRARLVACNLAGHGSPLG
jgi:hypothetical protein